MVILFSNYKQTGGKKKGKKKDTKDFIAFLRNLEKLSDREQGGTSTIIQLCKGEDRKFKFHVLESVWMNLKMKWCS